MNYRKENLDRVKEIEEQFKNIQETTEEDRIVNLCSHFIKELEGFKVIIKRFDKIESKMEQVREFIENETVASGKQVERQIEEVRELLVENGDRTVTFLETMDEPLWDWGDVDIESSGVWKGKVIDASPLKLYGMIAFKPKLRGKMKE